MIQFLIFNMTEEILGKYKNGELIRENEKNYLLLIEETEEDIEIYKAKEYIDQHLADKLTLNQVAEIVCLSPNYFSSMWKKEMQVGFVDYITEQRVEKAKELFATTDLRTHEVAELTGFGDDSYFSKIFRKVSGKNPGSFRKRNILLKKMIQ